MLKKSPSHPPGPGAPGRAFSHASFSPRKHPQRSPSGQNCARSSGRAGEKVTPPVLSSAAALLGTRRVSARQGWAGEKSGLFEHPAWYSPIALDTQTVPPPLWHNRFQQPASEAGLGPDVRRAPLEYFSNRPIPSEPSRAMWQSPDGEVAPPASTVLALSGWPVPVHRRRVPRRR